MRKFLTAFAAIAAGFATQSSPAAIADTGSTNAVTSALPDSTRDLKMVHGGRTTVVDHNGDEFNFVLKRSSETGVMMAYHESHASHRSHSSHRSHYSSR